MDLGGSAQSAVPADGAPPRPLSSPEVGRRHFIKLLLGFSVLSTLAMVITPVIDFLRPATSSAVSAGRVLAGTSTSIAPGTGKVVALGSKPIIVCNSPEGFKAYSAVCTHLGCIVGYDSSQSPDIVSPCHGGHFSVANGSVLAGPPPAPLKPYPIAIDKDQIYVQEA